MFQPKTLHVTLVCARGRGTEGGEGEGGREQGGEGNVQGGAGEGVGGNGRVRRGASVSGTRLSAETRQARQRDKEKKCQASCCIVYGQIFQSS